MKKIEHNRSRHSTQLTGYALDMAVMAASPILSTAPCIIAVRLPLQYNSRSTKICSTIELRVMTGFASSVVRRAARFVLQERGLR